MILANFRMFFYKKNKRILHVRTNQNKNFFHLTRSSGTPGKIAFYGINARTSAHANRAKSSTSSERVLYVISSLTIAYRETNLLRCYLSHFLCFIQAIRFNVIRNHFHHILRFPNSGTNFFDLLLIKVDDLQNAGQRLFYTIIARRSPNARWIRKRKRPEERILFL